MAGSLLGLASALNRGSVLVPEFLIPITGAMLEWSCSITPTRITTSRMVTVWLSWSVNGSLFQILCGSTQCPTIPPTPAEGQAVSATPASNRRTPSTMDMMVGAVPTPTPTISPHNRTLHLHHQPMSPHFSKIKASHACPPFIPLFHLLVHFVIWVCAKQQLQSCRLCGNSLCYLPCCVFY